ncbi:MAG: zf-TFIIB domain-containing protein [Polyangiaceae bacterium]|nr:zf-TFIIB domain-containing protein [Polyangiaceae bacterium]
MLEGSELRCPRCRVELYAARIPDLEIHACGTCYGAWVDSRWCQRLLAMPLSDAARALIGRLRTGPPGGSPPEAPAAGPAFRAAAAPTGALACPHCEAELAGTTTDERRHGVRMRLDVCGVHGTWFDAGELHALRRALSVREAQGIARAVHDAEARHEAARAELLAQLFPTRTPFGR